jgi:hypothetical protein
LSVGIAHSGPVRSGPVRSRRAAVRVRAYRVNGAEREALAPERHQAGGKVNNPVLTEHGRRFGGSYVERYFR